ncbi:MAG TPA: nucleotidyltransferase domain-containing protein [Pseudonocardiaceae bacterium]|nr:nucleotidyltransferase domain-containing protein [Pseudonocardiaceae bacterium]
MVISPIDAAQQLSAAAADGRLEALAEGHDLSLVVMFGSASRGQPDARDLDVAVGSRTRTGLDVLAVICALMDLVDSDRVDLLDLDRAGPVARQHALVPGVPLYEYRPGEFARQQMRASGQRLGTEWMRRLDLALMAAHP